MFFRFRYLFVSIFWLLTGSLYAQKENYVWIFGHGAGLDFNGTGPGFISSQIDTYEGCAAVADNNGQLLFYSNGISVWDANGNVMPNGSGLQGNGYWGNYIGSSTQGVGIVKAPGRGRRYYLFTLDAYEDIVNNLTPGYLKYSIIDMSLNGGLGDVVAGAKNLVLDSFMTEKMAITAADDCGYWLVVHRYDSEEYHSFKIASNGIDPQPIVSNGAMVGECTGEMKISPNGELIGWVGGQFGTQFIELGAFDKATGQVVGAQTFSALPPLTLSRYGLEFSPDNTKLYCTEWNKLLQYDISLLPNIGALEASRVVIDSTHIADIYMGMRLGPDQKVYVCRSRVFSGPPAYIGRINAPNNPGLSCGFDPMALTVPVSMTFPYASGGYAASLGATVVMNDNLDSVILAPTDVNVCFSKDTTLSLVGFDEVAWSDGTIGPRITVSRPGTLWAWAYSGCQLTIDTFHVAFIDFKVDLGPDTLLCTGDSLWLDPIGMPGATYVWQDGAFGPSYKVDRAGTYSVLVTYKGCQATASLDVDFIEPTLTIDSLHGPLCLGEQVTLKANAYPSSSYEWSTGGRRDTAKVDRSGVYSVKVENACGVFLDSLVVEMLDCNCPVFLPNAFTPNGDARNDEFLPRLNCEPMQYELRIFNRYGQMVFVTRNPNQGWDGKYLDRHCDVGVYFYRLLYTSPDGAKKEQKGDLHLMR